MQCCHEVDNLELIQKFVAREKSLVLLALFLGTVSAVFNGLSTVLIVPVLLLFFGIDLDSAGLMRAFPKISVPSHLRELVSNETLLLGLLVAILIKHLATIGTTVVTGALSRRWIQQARTKAFQLLLEVDLIYFVRHKSGELSSRVSGDISKASKVLSTSIALTVAILSILVLVVTLLWISWQLTVLAAAIFSAIILANQYFVRRAREHGAALSITSRAYSAFLQEILAGARIIKETVSERKVLKHMIHLLEEREKSEFWAQVNFALVNPCNELMGIAGLIALLLVGKEVMKLSESPFPALLATYLFVLYRLLPLVTQFNSLRIHLIHCLPSLEVVSDLLNRANKPIMSNGTRLFEGLQQGILLENVRFSYSPHDLPVLKGVDLQISRESTVALVGQSGSGKSTIASLLVRLYDVSDGSIKIDGCDIREFDVRSLRRAIGVVSQDTFLFNDSVRNNIAFARPESPDSEIINAAKQANCWEFIKRLPQGLDTSVGERGLALSGGQRQRIAIARCLLQNPEILILDEATSSLDSVSENLVLEAMEALKRNRTVLVIAHRLSTIRSADLVAVLMDGRIAELATHSELLAAEGHYAKMFSSQYDPDRLDGNRYGT